ncbi:MAG: hypothetical protein HY695_38255 [Deltaproteobacteria bacterium]|nr:hypothetical protein [Deltaproteobacteria bacterium]
MALVIAVFLFLCSCSFIGPQISSEEERRAQAILMAEGQAWQKKQEQKILEIAARVIGAAENVEPLKFHLYGLIWAHKAGFDVSAAKELWRRMAIEMPESIERGFLASHPSSAERFLSIEKVAETLKQGLDPIKVFASSGTRYHDPERN